MKTLLFSALACLVIAAPVLVFAFAPAPDAGARTVEHKVYNGYAESRDSGLKGEASFLAVASKADFSRLFAPVVTPRGLPDPIARNAFDSRLFVAVIKRDNVLWDYKVEKVMAKGDTLTVYYNTTQHKNAGPRRGQTVKEIRETRKEPAATTRKAAPKETKAARVETRKETKVETRKVTVKEYPTSERERPSSEAFDSVLILSVPKDKYATILFIENGRKAGTARIDN